ncbi:MAG: hydrogenase [Desulfobulbus sp.]|jgi:Ni,Fe-hydrogenase III large subunit|uniref:hydrogenase large subunit n=1 Tax=Desulfobulbus sp. TaxID=895 RepID=UPI002843333A|nr:hydrogenase [Desulfobulbus sp.]MDR2548657.1 hydrogenase [Desulfobulbus sp.]
MDSPLRIGNGEAVPRSRIPRIDFPRFLRMLTDFVHCNGYIVQFFAYAEGERMRLLAVLRNSDLHVVETEVERDFPSLTLMGGTKFHLFEREIAEQYGLRPNGHPWLKMVRYHANATGLPDVFGNDYRVDIPGNYDYYRVEGEAVHEVGVGPVHAGIIEPGHFRFQCAGEEVLHLEIQLGYQHRGVERLLTSVPQRRWPVLCESIAGDTAIGHNLCCCQAIEALAGLEVEPGARTVRTMALELERLANHIGDLGALSGDVAFNPPAAYFGRIRGEFLNLLLELSGNRFGKSLVRPGGVTQVAGAEQRRAIRSKIDELRKELAQVCDLLFSAHTVLARFEYTGTVKRSTADRLGLVGPCGRASGLEYDVREFFPTERYGELPANTNWATNGDVYSRAMVRRDEIMHSLDLVERLLAMPEEAYRPVLPAEHKLAPASFVVTLNEGWRGEVSHCLLTDHNGAPLRYKVKDPSFHNWTGLAMALRNQAISDFPLCNKSFNLSYCGFDL